MSSGNLPDRVPGFSGWKPTVDKDWLKLYEFLEAYAEQILIDPFEQGVLKDVGNELEVTIKVPSDPNTDAQVDTGAAWLEDSNNDALGLRIQLDTAQDVSLDAPATEDNIVYAKFSQTQTEFRNHYISGVSKYTRLIGGFTLGAVKESNWPVADAFPLAKVGLSGANIVVKEDLRQFLVLKPGYAGVSYEMNVNMVAVYTSGTSAHGPIFAVFRPSPDSLRTRIVVESLHAYYANASGAPNIPDNDIYVGVWDTSDPTNEVVKVNLKNLIAQNFVENVVGGLIGDSATDHRFAMGFSGSMPAIPGYSGTLEISLTIRYRIKYEG